MNNSLVVEVRQRAVSTVLNTVRECFRIARTVSHAVEGAEAEEAVEMLIICDVVAREILTIRVTEKLVAILHVAPPFE